MAVQWGFSTLGCAELDLGAVLALAREFACRAVELRFLNDSVDLVAELDKYLAVPGNAGAVASSGIDIVSLNTSFKLFSADPADLDAFKATALAADRLNARYLRVFDGPEASGRYTPAQREAAKRNYAEWKRWSREHGVRAAMSMETHGATSSTPVLLEVFDALGDGLPVIWDAHHTFVLGKERPAETWERIGARVVHVHVKDSVDTPSARHPYTYVLPGRGRIPAGEILALLEKSGFGGVASLEWERKWHPYLPPLREALQVLRDAGWREAAGGAARKIL